MAFLDRLKSIVGIKPVKDGKDLTSADASLENQRASVNVEAMAIVDRGNAVENAGNPLAAMALYDQAVAVAPNLARAHMNRGNVLAKIGRLDEAISVYRHALSLDPNSAGAHFNLGNVLATIGRPEEALREYEQTIALWPDFGDAELARGNVLDDLNRSDEALAAYERALVIRPDWVEAHGNLGLAYLKQAKLPQAIASLRAAVALAPGLSTAHSNLANALKANGDLELAIDTYQRALEIEPSNLEALSGLIFTLNYLANGSAAETLATAKRFGELATQAARPFNHWNNSPDPKRRLRVGIVSGDLREHPVGFFFESIIAALAASDARDHLELFAYSNHLLADSTTARIRAGFNHWTLVTGMDDALFVARVREDQIDVLIDLSGHTAHHRLPAFAWKPAPVQISWLGYFGTTGVPAMDYLLADPWSLPVELEEHFSERIWRMPETRLCFTPPRGRHPVAALPALTNGKITFGCFGHLTKANDGVIALWSRVLSAVPGSQLCIKAPQLGDSAARERLLARFAEPGIDATRLRLVGPSARAEYLDAYGDIDIVLDTFPFPGGTTSAESLWMGVPVLTLSGDRFLSRQGVSLLVNVGLADWVATSADDYVARAVQHTSDLRQLSALRSSLRGQVLAAPLFDAARFAGYFEQALREIWRQWCARQDVAANALAFETPSAPTTPTTPTTPSASGRN